MIDIVKMQQHYFFSHSSTSDFLVLTVLEFSASSCPSVAFSLRQEACTHLKIFVIVGVTNSVVDPVISRPRTHRECSLVPKEKCNHVPREACRSETERVCASVPREVCTVSHSHPLDAETVIL